MKKTDVLILLLLSVIWGASFLFLRIASDDFGPWALIFIRMLSAFLCISPLLFVGSTLRNIRQHFFPLLLLALFNQVLPFTLFAFATLQLEAGFTSLLNATTPIFTAFAGALLFAAPIHRHQLVGLAASFVGIFILCANKLNFSTQGEGWSILAGLAACVCYAWAANYTKKLSHLTAIELSTGTMLTSSLILLVPGLYFWPETNPDMSTWVSAVLLGALCTGLAFLLFYRLIQSAGAVSSTSVTILVPLFAVCWGALLLGEHITLRMLIGMILALSGTAITLKLLKWPGSLLETGRSEG